MIGCSEHFASQILGRKKRVSMSNIHKPKLRDAIARH